MVVFSEFIGEYFPFIKSSDWGKDNNLHCVFCGELLYHDGEILECCNQLKNAIKEKRREIEKREKNEAEIERAERIAIFNQNLNESGLEGKERGYKFSMFKTNNQVQAENKQICQDYAENDIVSLMISGTVGTGKTMLAVATAKKIAYNYKLSLDILRCSSIYEKDDIKIKNVGVLIIDDIGREAGSEARSESRIAFISEVIEYRMRNRMKTIFTTNLEREEIIKKYKSHIVDRILEDHMACKVMRFESLRGQNKTNNMENENG